LTDDRTSHAEQARSRSHKDRKPDFTQCDGQAFKRLIQAGLAWLERHQAAVNALNVYPVPDGDTGTNMLLTMQAAYAEIKD
jgi:dihydroxyacetone kinase-like predicted kinase